MTFLTTCLAEIRRLSSRRLWLVVTIVAAGYAGVSAALMVARARHRAPGEYTAGLSIDAFQAAGGATAALSANTRWSAVVVLALVIGLLAPEFSSGTLRTAALHQPGRLRLVAGKALAVFVVLAGALGVAALITGMVTWTGAVIRGWDLGAWGSGAAVIASAADIGGVLAWAAGWTLIATALVVVARSLPLALGIGVMWGGPVENILGDEWSQSSAWFPGLVLRGVAEPESAIVSPLRLVLTLGAYAVVLLGVTACSVRRRDLV